MLISLFVKYRIDYIKTNIYNCVNNNHLTEVFFILMRQVKNFKSHRITCNFSLQDKLKWAQLTELDDEHRNIIQSTRVEVVLDKELDWHSSNNTANKKYKLTGLLCFVGARWGLLTVVCPCSQRWFPTCCLPSFQYSYMTLDKHLIRRQQQ